MKDNILPIIVDLCICWTSLAHKYIYGYVYIYIYTHIYRLYDIFIGIGILSNTHTHIRIDTVWWIIYIYIYIEKCLSILKCLPFSSRHFSRGVSPSRIDASSLWWGRPTERPSEGEAKETFPEMRRDGRMNKNIPIHSNIRCGTVWSKSFCWMGWL